MSIVYHFALASFVADIFDSLCDGIDLDASLKLIIFGIFYFCTLDHMISASLRWLKFNSYLISLLYYIILHIPTAEQNTYTSSNFLPL